MGCCRSLFRKRCVWQQDGVKVLIFRLFYWSRKLRSLTCRSIDWWLDELSAANAFDLGWVGPLMAEKNSRCRDMKACGTRSVCNLLSSRASIYRGCIANFERCVTGRSARCVGGENCHRGWERRIGKKWWTKLIAFLLSAMPG